MWQRKLSMKSEVKLDCLGAVVQPKCNPATFSQIRPAVSLKPPPLCVVVRVDIHSSHVQLDLPQPVGSRLPILTMHKMATH
jgi:hypothetical protein